MIQQKNRAEQKTKSRLAAPESPAGRTREELKTWAQDEGFPAFRGEQLFQWMHQRQVRRPEEMHTLPAALRARLDEEAWERISLDEVLVSDDSTRKLLFRTPDNYLIESVLIPMDGYYTQCVSTQVGCRFGCAFCLTAQMGLSRHLGAHEIVDQVYLAKEVELNGWPIRNYVYMGMGEPLDNFDEVVRSCAILIDPKGLDISGRRITVSTVGVAPRIPELGRAVPVNLALSLNGTTDEQRAAIMPVNRAYPLEELRAALSEFPLPSRRRITIEYVMLGGFNDSDDDAKRLSALLKGLPVKVNLLPWNPFDNADFHRPSEGRVRAFQRRILDAGFATSIRTSKGLDIGAACGQLDGSPAS
jgi:23S rRNA (adenine2503-C2)-methyltransferase